MHRSGACKISQMENQPSPPGDAGRYPTELRSLAARLAPCGGTTNERPNAICPQRSINTQAPTALRGINRRPISNAQSMLKCWLHCVAPTNAWLWILDIPLLAETCLNVRSLLRFQHSDCHPQGRSSRRRSTSQRCIADNHCMHRSGGRTLFFLLARQIPPPR
ncbi:hypothetical protein LF1_54110 [Rubripirellula obstinata]|uniref:Uncharacterized protein n=1 Tax=Rubripirellula obstinata TaxID=406547 RepID=A0A5B1CAH4_9BACT|nr:hypothetical protein LF1_54110 [Rubripirellula obstinata]